MSKDYFKKRSNSPSHLVVECILLGDEITKLLRLCVGDGETDADTTCQNLNRVAEKCENLRRKAIKTKRAVKEIFKGEI